MAVALFVWFLEFQHEVQGWEQHICKYVNQVSPLPEGVGEICQ